MSDRVGRAVVDRTNLPGYFDLDLEFALPSRPGDLSGDLSDPAADHSVDSTPSIYTALSEQLGLKLESQKSSVDVLVIDNAQKPGPIQPVDATVSASVAAGVR